MTQRVQNSVTWTQTFDAENHLTSVSDGTTTTQYVYDSNGNRVKRIVGTTTTVYVAGMEIELHSGTEDHRTIYYAAGGAFRVIGGSNAGLYYRHTDHLGSTSVLSDSSGNKVANSDVVFAPFGETRVGSLSTLTDFGFTGQRLDRDSGGLMYYGARYYLPGLNRFISPDTIVPSMSDPQSLNRYTYVRANPLKYTDPTGHCDDADGNGKCDAIERKSGVTPSNTTSPSGAGGNSINNPDTQDNSPETGPEDKPPLGVTFKTIGTFAAPGLPQNVNFSQNAVCANCCGVVTYAAAFSLDPWAIKKIAEDSGLNPQDGLDATAMKTLLQKLFPHMSISVWNGYLNSTASKEEQLKTLIVNSILHFEDNPVYLIPYVSVDGSHGELQEGGAPHWLLITGISEDWN